MTDVKQIKETHWKSIGNTLTRYECTQYAILMAKFKYKKEPFNFFEGDEDDSFKVYYDPKERWNIRNKIRTMKRLAQNKEGKIQNSESALEREKKNIPINESLLKTMEEQIQELKSELEIMKEKIQKWKTLLEMKRKIQAWKDFCEQKCCRNYRYIRTKRDRCTTLMRESTRDKCIQTVEVQGSKTAVEASM